MQTVQIDQAQDARLRFVFDSTVLSFGLEANATFGDIARKLGNLSIRRYGHPVAIDVRLSDVRLSPAVRAKLPMPTGPKAASIGRAVRGRPYAAWTGRMNGRGY